MAETISATITVKDNLSSAIKSMTKALEGLCSQFAALDKAIEGSAANMSAVSKAMSGINAGAAEKAASAFSAVEKQSSSAAEAVSDVTDAMNSVNTGGAEKAADAVEGIGSEAQTAAQAVGEVGDAMDTLGGSGADSAKTSLSNVKTEAGSAEKAVSSLADQLERAAAAAAKITLKGLGVAFGAAATGVAAITKSSVSAYADYQQYEGGVQTLFGAGGQSVEQYADSVGKSVEKVQASYDKLMAAQNAVMNNAKQAYMTAGVSANDYMDMATQLSASLVSSLGGDTQKAADKVERAIVDMSDNVNKMGTTMESVEYAYKGFAKQNFTMLDNLKLGYGGSKEEMKRLLSDAQKLSGVKYDISSLSDMIDAIHVIQENMGITGTTELEAKETISGSWNALKAAWSNTLTSMVEGGEWFDQCIDALVNTAVTFGDNIMPAIEGALSGLGQLIERLAPILEEHLPTMIENILPSLITAATSLVKAFIKTLPSIFSAVVDALPDVISQIGDAIAECFADIPIVGKLGKALSNNAEGLAGALPYILGIAGGSGAILGIASKVKGLTGLFGKSSGSGSGMFSWLESLAKIKVTTVLKGIANISIILGGMTALVAAFGALTKIPGFTEMMADGGTEFLSLVPTIAAVAAVGSALASVSGLIGKIPVSSVALGLTNIAAALGGMTAIVAAFGALSKIPHYEEFMDGGVDALKQLFNGLSEVVGSLVGGFSAGLSEDFPTIGENLGAFAENAAAFFTALSGVDINGTANFMSGIADLLTTLVSGKVQDVLSNTEGMADLDTLGAKLTSFSVNMKGFFNNVKDIPAESFIKAQSFFETLSYLSELPNSGGIGNWFGGTVEYDKIASGLEKLGGEGVAAFFDMAANIPEGALDSTVQLFETLAYLDELPTEGGAKGGLFGNLNLTTIADGLSALAPAITAFNDAVANVKDISKFTEMFEALKQLDSIDFSTSGGFINGVTAYWGGVEDMDAFATKLTKLGDAVGKFSEATADVTASKFSTIATALQKLNEIELPTDAGGTDWETFGTNLTKLAEGVNQFASDTANVNAEQLSGVVTQLQGVTEALNALNTDMTTLQAVDLSGLLTAFDGMNESITTADAELLTIITTVQTVSDELYVWITYIGTMFDMGFAAIATSVTAQMAAISGEFGTGFAGCADVVYYWMGYIGTQVDTAMSEIIVSVTGKMTEFTTELDTGFSSAVALATECAASMRAALSIDTTSIGENIVNGMINGINSRSTALLSTVQTLASRVASMINSALEIGSPSRLTFETGKYVVMGLGEGLLSQVNWLKSQIGEVTTVTAGVGGSERDWSAIRESAGNSFTYNTTRENNPVTVYMTNSNTISNDMDIETVARKLANGIKTQMQLERG